MTMKEKLYLWDRINFGPYRKAPRMLSDIIDTPAGLKWTLWMMDNSVMFEFDKKVHEYVKRKMESDGRILQPERSK
jgi:hypothetical protein